MKKENVIAGYTLRQAFSEIDSAYAAAMSVTKACYDQIVSKKAETRFFRFAFPVIVVDTPLIRFTLDDRGKIELEETEQGEFLFAQQQYGTCIRVVTISHLPTFASEARGVASQLHEELKIEEEQLLKERPLKPGRGLGQ